jgi:hypothetical protein
MHIFLLFFLFFQTPQSSFPAQQALINETPQQQLARAEAVIKDRQKAAEHATQREANAAQAQVTWHQQGIARTKEKNDLIDKAKFANHLDASWTWDDATSHFVQKK